MQGEGRVKPGEGGAKRSLRMKRPRVERVGVIMIGLQTGNYSRKCQDEMI